MTAAPLTAQQGGSGFSQSFNRETRKWRSTFRWGKQAILWTLLLGILTFLFFAILAPVSGIINVLNEVYAFLQDRNVLALIRALEGAGSADNVQFSTASLVLPMMISVGSTLIGQAIIVILTGQYFSELKSGTLGWALSRPIQRGAYVASKVLADGIGILLMMVLIPFGVLFIITVTTARAQDVSFGNYTLAVFLVLMLLVFWHALVTMLTFVTRSRAITLAIPLLLLLLGGLISRSLDGLLNLDGVIQQISPWALRGLIGPAMNGTLDLANTTNLVPIIATVVWIVLLYVLAWLGLRRMDV